MADTLSVGANQTTGFFGDVVAHTLRAEGFDASEDGTGRGTPLVPCIHADAIGRDGVSRTAGPDAEGRVRKRDAGLGVAQDGTSYSLTTGKPHAVALSVALRGRDGGATAELGDDQSFALRASQGGGDKPHILAFDTTQVTSKANRSNPKPGDPCHPLAAGAHPPAVAFEHVVAPSLTASNDPSRSPQSSEVTQQVAAVHRASMAVRRITPREAERLQGFPDDYTRIPYRGKPAEDCPDGPRYKALGNSMAVPVMAWIGERIAMVEAP